MTPSMNDELQIVNQEDENSLSHYGVKGQKWGQRNYQNPDGTYTELGKERRRVAFIREEKKKEEDANAHQNGIEESIDTGEDTKIGGKAYKDMTRKELRAAKKRARHNEKERKAQREFNRDKREAIEAGDMSFISKNISKFTNDEIDETIARLKRMQAIKDIEAANKQRSERYIDKALKFLDKASNATNSLTNIYNKINESQQKSIAKKKLQKEYDKIVNPDKYKSSTDLLKETLDLEKTEKELKELREGKQKTTKEILEEEKALKDLDKLRNPDKYKTSKELYDEEKAQYDLDLLRNPNKNPNYVFDKAKADMEIEIAKKNRALAEQEQIKADKAFNDYLKTLSASEAWDAAIKREEEQAKANSKYWFSGQYGSSKKGKKSSNEDFDLDDKSVNKITKKYIGQFKDAPKDYFKEDQVRDNQWRKDMKKHDADVVDKWVKDMKKKYMKERNMDAKAAEQKAEDYVESWLEAYDEDLLKELKK